MHPIWGGSSSKGQITHNIGLAQYGPGQPYPYWIVGTVESKWDRQQQPHQTYPATVRPVYNLPTRPGSRSNIQYVQTKNRQVDSIVNAHNQRSWK